MAITRGGTHLEAVGNLRPTVLEEFVVWPVQARRGIVLRLSEVDSDVAADSEAPYLLASWPSRIWNDNIVVRDFLEYDEHVEGNVGWGRRWTVPSAKASLGCNLTYLRIVVSGV